MNRNKTITVGITAYNEEANVKNVILDVLRQKTTHCNLIKIVVISDGSSDKTVSRVRSIGSKKIQLIIGKTRLGKASRINYLLHNLTTDYLVLLDADVRIPGDNALDSISKEFGTGKKTGIVQAYVRPVTGNTFIERAVNNFFYSRDSIIKVYNYGNSVYGARGACMAISKPLSLKTTLPINIINDDAYLYFKCKFSGYIFTYTRNIEVVYRSPQTMKELHSQTTRYAHGENQIHEYFNRPETHKEYAVSKKVLYTILLIQLIRNPLGYITIKLINSLALVNMHISHNGFNHKWNIIASSKMI